ncbi:hypothetical protein GCM10022280_12680 [Sphingomonas swuensis]|uniref:Lipoprotein n=2 Tax=Sphingomonas swuensis TaxID=977800 RepID=A0ABP7SRN1_9SPHN
MSRPAITARPQAEIDRRALRKRIAATFAASLAFLAAGCAHTRYVTVSCVTPEQAKALKNAKPGKVGSQLTGKADSDIRLVSGRLVRVEAWGDGLMHVIEGCAARQD